MIRRSIAILSALCAVSVQAAPEITFGEPVDLSSEYYSSEGKPTVIDWDGDGLFDILFGERVPGSSLSFAQVGYWRNTGTAAEPQFVDVGDLQADDAPISVECG